MDYAWGQSGPKAFIFDLLRNSLSAVKEASPKTAAELWMGAHPKASAQILTSRGLRSLESELSLKAEHYLGPELAAEGHRRLSFLFKVLDAKKPLSIQAHPDAQLAKELHSQKPEHYPDPYPKPELAICIRDMQALFGFQPIDAILTNLHRNRVLAKLCKTSSEYETEIKTKIKQKLPISTKSREWLKQRYAALMQTSPDELEKQGKIHLSELEQRKSLRKADSLFISFSRTYGLRDSGIFSAYFLNYIELKTGEAIFLEPNSPHSYIQGVILECMAASDNVVRAGLSSKYCDIPTLIEMLHYKAAKPQTVKTLKKAGVYSYPIPIKDFSLCFYTNSKCKIEEKVAKSFGLFSGRFGKTQKAKKFALENLNRPSILLLLGERAKGELIFYSRKRSKEIKTQTLQRGNIFFLPGDLEAKAIRVLLNLSKGKLYRASGSIP